MASLYEIDARLQALEQYLIDIETGEVVETEDQFNQLYNDIAMDLDKKIENTMCFYKNLLSDAQQIKAEEKALAQRRKIKEKLAERLKDNVDNYIKQQFLLEDGTVDKLKLNKYKFETSKIKLSYRKSESVEIKDETKIPKQFFIIKTTETPDKNKIKKELKNGNKINGAELNTNINMQVK